MNNEKRKVKSEKIERKYINNRRPSPSFGGAGGGYKKFYLSNDKSNRLLYFI